MSLKKRVKKAVSKVVNKLPQVQIFKKAKSMFSGGGDSSSSGDEGLRSEAAKRLVNRNQQAGSGSISFTTEEYS